jgi:CPA2 family monovalent cation:H+ antiporter-2
MQLLTESRRLAQPGGRTALGLLLFQDLLVAPILIFVGFVGRDADGGLLGAIVEALVEGTLAIGAIVFVGRFLLRHVFGLAAQAGGRDLLMALTLLTVVGAAVVTAGAGLSLALGAFMAGLLLGETEFKHQAEVDLDPFKGLLLGLFFMTVGMGLDLGGILRSLPVVVAGLAGLLVTKFVLVGLACRLLRVPGRIALETAFVLAPAGEFAFVVLSTAVGLDVLDRSVANLAAAVAGLSMLLVPFLDVFGRRVARRLAPDGPQSPWISSYEGLEGHVIIAGFGRVGSAIADILRSEETDFVALDRAPHRVAQCRNRGWKVYLGDADRPEILHRAGADGAAMLIVTVDDPASAERMVRAFRRVRPEAPILARARDHEHARALVAAGASFVIPDAIEAGLQMAARALEDFGYPRETARDLISAVRDAEYRSATA